MGCELSSLNFARKACHKSSAIVEAADSLPKLSKSDSRESNFAIEMFFGKKRISGDHPSTDTCSSLKRNGLLNRGSFTRQRSVEDMDAVVTNKTRLDLFFSEFEKDVLLSTWAVLSGETFQHGISIFTLAGEMFPGLRDIFDIKVDATNQMIITDKLTHHCQAYMKLIDDAIKCLEYPNEEFYDALLIAGAGYAILQGMKTEYFKIFKRATLTSWESLLAEEFTENVKNVWQALLDYIIFIMSEGCRAFEHVEEMVLLEELPADAVKRHLHNRPSVINMSPQEWAFFNSTCK